MSKRKHIGNEAIVALRTGQAEDDGDAGERDGEYVGGNDEHGRGDHRAQSVLPDEVLQPGVVCWYAWSHSHVRSCTERQTYQG